MKKTENTPSSSLTTLPVHWVPYTHVLQLCMYPRAKVVL